MLSPFAPNQAQRRPPGSGHKPRSRAGEARQRPSADVARRRASERVEQRLKRLLDEQEALPRLAALTQGAALACPCTCYSHAHMHATGGKATVRDAVMRNKERMRSVQGALPLHCGRSVVSCVLCCGCSGGGVAPEEGLLQVFEAEPPADMEWSARFSGRCCLSRTL